MDPLIAFSIPVRGLRDGIHQFDFQIDRSFFGQFESAPVQEGDVSLQLELIKRPGLYTLTFSFEGTVKTECDRCLAPIDLPIEGEQRLLIKVSEAAEGEPAEDPEQRPEQDGDADRLVLAQLRLCRHGQSEGEQQNGHGAGRS